jgi:serine/threonine protein kinase
MPFTKQPHLEPIPGYRLLAPLGSGGFGEVWKCEAPGGLCKAIKFVYGDLKGVQGNATQAHEELQAIQRIKDLRHPFLLSIDRVEAVGGELMIVTELADRSLYELLLQCQQQGRQGIAREDLLHYLGEAAEVLDLMNVRHGLQHLDVKPRNLFLVSNHVKVADFGLVTSLAASGTGKRSEAEREIKLGAVTPLYAAPEVFQGQVSRSSDQYSLAVCYVELLTGKLPFDGRNSRQLLMQHLQAEPDLSALDDADRPLVARALAKDPSQRYPSCRAFLRALQGRPLVTMCDFSLEEHEADDWLREEKACVPHHDVAPAARTEHEALAQTPRNREADIEVSGLPGLLPTPRGLTGSCRGPSVVPATLAEYQFLESQGSSLLADLWKVTAPDGRSRQARFIYGLPGPDLAGLQEAVRRFQALQHPALPETQVVQTDPGRLVVVHDLARDTLRERWQKCLSQKLPGIPRAELLGYLHTVAEVVDYLYQQHAVCHLGLNPRTLQFVDGSLQVADFGLAHLFWLPAGQPVAQRNARYAAPELFAQQAHHATDQYSLALMYQELLTGAYAFTGQSRTSMALVRGKVKPDLGGLPAGDRTAIARALDADPQQRWPTCGDLVRRLEEAGSASRASVRIHVDPFAEIIAGPHAAALPQKAGVGRELLTQLVKDLLAQAGGEFLADGAEDQPTLSAEGAVLTHRFRAGLPIGAARVKVDGFRRQANGQLLCDEEEAYAFHVATPTRLWQQWIGRQPGLDVGVQLSRPHALSATPIDVAVTIKAVRCGKKKAVRLVQDFGTNLLEGLRAFLLVNSEKRLQDRLLWPHPVQVCGVDRDGAVGPPVACRGKDLSLSGMGFYLPHELPTCQVLIHLPGSAQSAPISIPATLMRAQRCADGWYDVGALFRLATLRKSMSEECYSWFSSSSAPPACG